MALRGNTLPFAPFPVTSLPGPVQVGTGHPWPLSPGPPTRLSSLFKQPDGASQAAVPGRPGGLALHADVLRAPVNPGTVSSWLFRGHLSLSTDVALGTGLGADGAWVRGGGNGGVAAPGGSALPSYLGACVHPHTPGSPHNDAVPVSFLQGA